MKKFLSLSALLLSITFLLLQTNSYTVAKVKNEAQLSIVSEENSLIAITYEQGKKFRVTNNTNSAITIDSVTLIGGDKQKIIKVEGKDIPFLSPGQHQTFNITNDPKELPGKVIQVVARWDGGSAQIRSTIPYKDKR